MTQQRVSPITVTSQLPATATLTLQGATGQSAKLLDVKTSAGTSVFSVDNSGVINDAISTTELGYLDGVTSAIQTQLDAKIPKTLTTTTGDIIYASSANTPARLGIGTSSQVLTVSGGVPAWATPASGSMTQIATGSLTGATVTISSISSAYKDLRLVLNNVSISANDEITLQINGYTSGYNWMSFRAGTSSPDYSISGNQIKIPTGNTLATDTSYRAVINFPNYSTSGPVFCNFNGVFNCNAANTGLQVFMGTGSNTTSAVISSITLKANWGGAYTFDNGTYTLFGVN
jgi:hypothetical protein